MKTEHFIIGAGAVISVILINQNSKKFFDSDNESFRDGFYAGFFTSGPFTILAVAGALAVSI